MRTGQRGGRKTYLPQVTEVKGSQFKRRRDKLGSIQDSAQETMVTLWTAVLVELWGQ